MATPESDPEVRAGLIKAGVPQATRHLFLCIGPDCCSVEEGEQSWEFLKKQIRSLGIRAMRTKAACFRICAGGPWLAVYPEGIWYGRATPERLERILREHVAGGQPIPEWIAARNGCPLREG